MKLHAPLLLTAALLMTGCANTGVYGGTDSAVCDSLRPVLPTWSTHDTEQSKAEAVLFLDVFQAICGGQ